MNQGFNIYQTLEESKNKFPKHTAISDSYGELSYAGLFKATEELKSSLYELGVGVGDRIGIICSNDRHFIICLYAAVATDALVMPIAANQKSYEVIQSINEAGLQYVLGNKGGEINQLGFSTEVLSHSYLLSKTRTPRDSKLLDVVNRPAFMRFTSGTTGKAKGVVLSHRSVWERIESANEVLQLNQNDKVLWLLPMAYHFVVSIVLYIRVGAAIVVNNGFLAKEIVESIAEKNISFFYGSPTHIKLLANYNNQASLSGLRYIISTTSGLTDQLCTQFYEKYSKKVNQAFGIIEVGLPIVNINSSNVDASSVGHCLPAYDLSIQDEEGQELPIGDVGMLALKGPGMFDAYLSPLMPRDEVLHNGWFYTGDLARINTEGVVHIMGRKKNVINVHGNKVFPNEVEEVLNLNSSVNASKVFAKKHPLLGEMVCAEVELNTPVDEEQLIAHCHKYLSLFKVPKRIYTVKEIELTNTGKIKRS